MRLRHQRELGASQIAVPDLLMLQQDVIERVDVQFAVEAKAVAAEYVGTVGTVESTANAFLRSSGVIFATGLSGALTRYRLP